MAKPFDYDSYTEMFLDQIRQANPNGRTADTYATAYQELGDWLGELPAHAVVRAKSGQRDVVEVPAAIFELADLTHVHLNAFIRHLQTREQLPGGHHRRSSRAGRKLAPATVNNRYRAISSFVNWLFTQPDFSDAGPSPMPLVPAPKVVTKTVEVFDLEQLQALLATCGTGRRRPFLDVRDEAILRVFCEAGPRRGEVATIKLANVEPRQKRLKFEGEDTKALTDRYLYFGNRTRVALDRYIALRASQRHRDLPALWIAPKGSLTSGGLYQMIRRRGVMAGIKIHPHQLRHSFADRYLEGGGRPENLKVIGGWTSDKAMEIYTRARAGQRAQAEHAALALGDQL